MSNLNPNDRDILDNFKGMTVGQIFTKARTSQNLDVEQIANYLNIGSAHLDAIEADDKQSLPPQVYAVGFVRAYADVLGLDSEKMAYLFKVQCYGVKQTEEQKAITTKRQGETVTAKSVLSEKMDSVSPNFAFLAVIAAGILLIISIVWLLLWLIWPNDDDKNIGMVPDVNDVIVEQSDDIEKESFVETNQAPPIEPMDVMVRPEEGSTAYGAEMLEADLVLKAVEESWVEIRAVQSGKVLMTRTLKTGDVFYTPKDTDILLTSGNAGGIEVYLDGASLGLLGDKREIVRLRPLSVDALRLQNAQ